MRKELLLGHFSGEDKLKSILKCVAEENVFTKKTQWRTSTPEYDINPFGKLLRTPVVYHTNGKIKNHPKYHHGFYINMNCTEEFYNKNKYAIDKVTVKEEWILTESHPPKWL